MSNMSSTPDSPYGQAIFLRTLPAIRARCTRVHDLAEKGALHYFDYHPERLLDVIAFCASIMQVCVALLAGIGLDHFH